MSTGNDDHLIWTEKVRRKVIGFRGYDIYRSRRRDARGRKADFTIVDAPEWCNVVAPVSFQGEELFVMARQFRHASQSITIEFPGGVVDVGEEPMAAALREFEEETGYRADSLDLIGVTFPNPAIMTNRAWTYLARGVVRRSEQSLDEHELLDAELVPIREIRELIRDNFHTHSIMMCALQWYEQYLRDGLTYPEREARWKTNGPM